MGPNPTRLVSLEEKKIGHGRVLREDNVKTQGEDSQDKPRRDLGQSLSRPQKPNSTAPDLRCLPSELWEK